MIRNRIRNMIRNMIRKTIKLFILAAIVAIVILGFTVYTKKCLSLGLTNKIKSIEDNSSNRPLLVNNFSCQMTVTYFSNGLKTEYEINYEVKKDDANNKEEILTYKKPEKFLGMQIFASKESIKHLNPYITKNLTYYTSNVKNYNEILLTTFIRNYFLSNDSKMSEDREHLIYETKIPKENFYFNHEKLICDKESKKPLKLIIYSKEKKEICMIDYRNFKEYNDNKSIDENNVNNGNNNVNNVNNNINNNVDNNMKGDLITTYNGGMLV